ncbi:hypothetical protein D9M73_277160 [compost metagenome]
MAIGEVEQVGGGDATVGEVGQQRVGVGKQAQLRQSFEQLPGQCVSQHGCRAVLDHVMAEQGVESFLDLIVHSSRSWFRHRSCDAAFIAPARNSR